MAGGGGGGRKKRQRGRAAAAQGGALTDTNGARRALAELEELLQDGLWGVAAVLKVQVHVRQARCCDLSLIVVLSVEAHQRSDAKEPERGQQLLHGADGEALVLGRGAGLRVLRPRQRQEAPLCQPVHVAILSRLKPLKALQVKGLEGKEAAPVRALQAPQHVQGGEVEGVHLRGGIMPGRQGRGHGPKGRQGLCGALAPEQQPVRGNEVRGVGAPLRVRARDQHHVPARGQQALQLGAEAVQAVQGHGAIVQEKGVVHAELLHGVVQGCGSVRGERGVD